MDQLKALETFVRVVHAGSFRQAAFTLGVAPQATSKSVRQLEAALGVRLLHRTTRKLSLTEEGEQLLAQITPAFGHIQQALQEMQHQHREVGGTLRVTAPRAIGMHMILPLISAFMAEYPEVRVELELEDHLTDHVLERVDLGFRMSAGMDRNVIARRLMDISQWVCAAPSYLAAHGTPESWAALATHRCTGFRHANSGRIMPWERVAHDEVSYTEFRPCFTSNDLDAEVHAVVAGVGIGQLPSFIAQPLVAAGQLVHVLQQHETARIGLFIYYPQRQHLPQRARRFIDFVIQRMQAASPQGM